MAFDFDFLLAVACERICIEIHRIENKFVIVSNLGFYAQSARYQGEDSLQDRNIFC